VGPVARNDSKACSLGEQHRYSFNERQAQERADNSAEKFGVATLKVQRGQHSPDQDNAEQCKSNNEVSDFEIVPDNHDILH